jgi:hypothetical protein
MLVGRNESRDPIRKHTLPVRHSHHAGELTVHRGRVLRP